MKLILILILSVVLSANTGCILKDEPEMKLPTPQSTPPPTPALTPPSVHSPADIEIYADNLTPIIEKGSSVVLNLTIIGKNVTGGTSISFDYSMAVLYPDGTVIENPFDINLSFKPQQVVFPETINRTGPPYKLYSNLTITSAVDGDYIFGIKIDKNTFAQMYLFSWDKIPGNDNERLIKYIKYNFDIDWVKTAKIEKFDGDKTIRVYTEKNSISLRLNDEKTRVSLKIDEGVSDIFIAKAENGKLNVYAGIIHLKVGKGGNLSKLYPGQCIPLGYAYFDRIPAPGSKGVPVTTNISISFSRPPSIVELGIKPVVEIRNITQERVSLASGKFTFHPTKPLQHGTIYTVTVTYGQKNPPKDHGNFCLTSNTTWQFVTAYNTYGGGK